MKGRTGQARGAIWSIVEGVVLAKIANFILFQLAWIAAITGSAHHWVWLPGVPALAVTCWHILRFGRRYQAEAAVVLAIATSGIAVECFFVVSGTLAYADAGQPWFLPPLAIMALWLAFGTLAHGSLSWLAGRPLVQAFLGTTCGPLSYLAGVRLGAAQFGLPGFAPYVIIALVWALLLPLIFWLAARIETRYPAQLATS